MTTKNDIVLKVAGEMNKAVQTQLVKEIVQRTLDEIINVLAAEGRLELRNFGVFEVRKRKARKARNPLTGETVYINDHKVVMFSSGRVMAEKIGGKIVTSKTPVESSGQQ